MLTPFQTWSTAHMLLAAFVGIMASWALRRRVVSSSARPAAAALRAFWGGLGATALVQCLMLLVAATGVGPRFALVTVLLAYGASVVALGALAAYFAFMFTGWRGAVTLVVALYSGVLALGFTSLVRAEPIGLRLTRWSYEPVYAQDPSGLLAAAPAVAALLPAIGGSLAFLVLGLRSTGATRQRGVLVGTALVLWFTATLFVSTGAATSDLAAAISKIASTFGLAAILLAYLPPRALRERWGLVALGEEHEFARRQQSRERTKQRLRESLGARVRELV